MNAPLLFSLKGLKIFVSGHNGMVGSAIARRLRRENCTVLTADRSTLDLRVQEQTYGFLDAARPDAVVVAAAKVGGIAANSSLPADFLLDNLAIAQNLIAGSFRASVRKLLFLGSSCIYPRDAPQPMTEEMLLTGALEPTNEWYAVAKISGIKLCQAFRRQHGADFIAALPTNLYGPGDNYHPEHSHAPAALIRRMHEAKLANRPAVTVWGTGKPRREFLSVDDLADAAAFMLQRYSGDGPLNIGTGRDVGMDEFARLVAETVGYRGKLAFDATKPDGAPRKLLDVSKLSALGWRAHTELKKGLELAYADYLSGGGRNSGISRHGGASATIGPARAS